MFSERSVGFPFSPCGLSVGRALGEGSALAAVPILAEFQNLLGSFYKNADSRVSLRPAGPDKPLTSLTRSPLA